MNAKKKELLIRLALVAVAAVALLCIGLSITYWVGQDVTTSFKVFSVCTQSTAVLIGMVGFSKIIAAFRE